MSLDPALQRVDRDHRRQAILDVAGKLFLEEGFASASMAAIAARVGGSKGTLYNYFPSKESLFAALVRRECETMLLDPLIQQGVADDPVEGLRQIGLSFTTATLGEHALSLQRLVVAEACRFPELGRVFYENGPKRYVSLIADWIAHQADRGRLRVADKDLAASQFLDLCRSNLMNKALWNVDPPPSPAARRRSVEGAVEVFMAAYGVPGER